MKTYTIRFFSLVAMNSIAELQVRLGEMGYILRPAGTNILDLYTSLDDPAAVRIELARAPDARAQEAIMAFIEAVGQQAAAEAITVLNALARTQAVVRIDVPEDVDEGVWFDIVDHCASLSEGNGLVQVDGEGFYENGVLILTLQ
ncbi:MAG TPA: hypothetical protein VHP83_01495 [Aggregatilineaceae bacterium]|nr:hypothetical protein [Aggregatilineaceae bacterium]